jgi:NDP-sugar pyrophosphorylase family protein
MNNIPVVILAGGLATRLKPITNTIPKGMLMINNKPFLQHQLELLDSKGIRNVILCVGHLGKTIEDFFGSKFQNIQIQYSYDGDSLIGTGGAVKKAILKCNIDMFGVLYGDSYLDINYLDIITYFLNVNVNGLMTVFKNDNLYDKSNVIFENGQILRYDKSGGDDMKYIDYGFGIYRKDFFLSYPDNIFDLSKIIIQLINKNQLVGYEVFNRFHEIGSFFGIEEFSNKLQR